MERKPRFPLTHCLVLTGDKKEVDKQGKGPGEKWRNKVANVIREFCITAKGDVGRRRRSQHQPSCKEGAKGDGGVW